MRIFKPQPNSNDAHMEEAIKTAYARSLLGGGLQYNIQVHSRSHVSRHIVAKIQAEYLKAFSQLCALRVRQPVIDVVVRNQLTSHFRKLCVPHLPLTIPQQAQRWSSVSATKRRRRLQRSSKNRTWVALRKMQLDLPSILWYMLYRCAYGSHSYVGALVPYTVTTVRESDHANMIYLQFTRTTTTCKVKCILIEPNGPDSTRTYPDGLRRLRAAWARVVTEASRDIRFNLVPQVHVLGATAKLNANQVASNLHSLVGRRESHIHQHLGYTMKRRKYSGYGICAAITHWIVYTWIQGGCVTSLDTHYQSMCGTALANPYAMKHQVLAFIQLITKKIYAVYSSKLRAYMKKDCHQLRKRFAKMHSEFDRIHMTAEVVIKTNTGQHMLSFKDT